MSHQSIFEFQLAGTRVSYLYPELFAGLSAHNSILANVCYHVTADKIPELDIYCIVCILYSPSFLRLKSIHIYFLHYHCLLSPYLNFKFLDNLEAEGESVLVLRGLKPDTLNSNHSIEAAFYKVRVTMTTDTILMQLHKCFSDLSSMLEAVAGFTLTGCYICRPRACVGIVCVCVSPDLSTNRGSLGAWPLHRSPGPR